MRRRDAIGLIAAAAVGWPVAARAEEDDRVRRVAVLMGIGEHDANARDRIQAFKDGLEQRGWIQDRNVQIDIRWAAGDAERGRTYATELVGMAPDVVVANSLPMLKAVRRETDTIPIIFVQMPDPVGTGAVTNLAKPEANVTGFTSFEYTMSTKWMQLIKEILPRANRVSFLFNPVTAAGAQDLYMRSIQAAAPLFDVRASATLVQKPDELDGVVTALAGEPPGGLIIMPDLFTSIHKDKIIALAARHRVLTIYPYGFFAEAGGLLSYGLDNVDLYRRAAAYVDRVFHGAKPADLPVQQPTKFEMIVNLKTAAALGIAIPMSVLVRADKVIE